jgi:catechol 2,3-dioxygenase
MDVDVQVGSRPGPAQTTADDVVSWGPVHLDVTDERRSLEFWGGTIGLQVLGRSAGGVRLGVDDAELLVLHPGAIRPALRGHSGLYHLAIHLPSEAEFARVLGRLVKREVRNAPTDHIMHWATYLDDPDGIGLELSFETLDRFGRYGDPDGPLMLVDSEGRRRGPTEPLDLREVFSHLGDRDFEAPLPAGSRVGHVHLHVGAIAPALGFYEAVGFSLNVDFSQLGGADMHAGGGFPHRLAVNTWQGAGAPQPPPGTAGLRHLVLRLRSASALVAATERLTAGWGNAHADGSSAGVITSPADAADGGVMVRDPAGNRTLLALLPA